MPLPERRYGRILAIGVNGPVDRLGEPHESIVQEMRKAIGHFLDDRAG